MDDKYTEDGMELWRKFAGSGRIADYLSYRSVIHNKCNVDGAAPADADTAERR